MHDRPFNTDTYLATAGLGGVILRVKPREIFPVQGDRADSVFHLQSGRAKLTVVSRGGKEAAVTLLAAGDCFDEECMAESCERRTTSAMAMTVCVVLTHPPFSGVASLRSSRLIKSCHATCSPRGRRLAPLA
jgi:CRP/FNR family transcriptional regulator, cyclic AMP receptor protein